MASSCTAARRMTRRINSSIQGISHLRARLDSSLASSSSCPLLRVPLISQETRARSCGFFRRVRVLTGWQTDRIQISGLSTQQSSMISSALRNNYNHVEFDVLFDLTSKLTLRGGYRYVWGDSSSFVLPVSGLIGPESVSLKRNIGKAGFSYRPLSQFSITGDYEGAGTDNAYFRTSLIQLSARQSAGLISDLAYAVACSRILGVEQPESSTQH